MIMSELRRIPLDAVDAEAFLSHKPLPKPPSAGGTPPGSWLDQAANLFTTIVAEPFHEVGQLIRKGPGARARSPEPRFASAAPDTVPIDVRRLHPAPEPGRRTDSLRPPAPLKAPSHLQDRTQQRGPPPPKLQIQIPIKRDLEHWLDVLLEEQLGTAPRHPPSPQSCPARPCLRRPHYDNFIVTPKTVTFSVGPPRTRSAPQLPAHVGAMNLRAASSMLPAPSQRHAHEPSHAPSRTSASHAQAAANLMWPSTLARPAVAAAPRARRFGQRD